MLRSLFHSFVVALVAAIIISLWIHLNILNSSDFVSSSMSSMGNTSSNHIVQVAVVIMVVVWVSSFADKLVSEHIFSASTEKYTEDEYEYE